MLQRLRESLTIVLLTLLPLHAFAVTVLTKFFRGAGHAPLPMLALWKEALLGLILALALIELLGSVFSKQGLAFKRPAFDVLDACIFLGILYAFVQFLVFGRPESLSVFALGFKYDFLPLVAFFVLRRAAWSDRFQVRAFTAIALVATIVGLYGIMTLFVPMDFFLWLGYSDLHSLYQSDAPLAAFQQIDGTLLRRMQSTMSGPNQLGLWMLMPLSIVLFERKALGYRNRGVWLFMLSVILAAIILSFSRAAWIGAAVIVAVFLWRITTSKRALFLLLSCACLLALSGAYVMPQVFLRGASLVGHIERPLAALRTIALHPLGLGLGSAGPASNRFSDTCVLQEAGTDVSWAADRPNLCVFVGGTQVQPVSRVCSCPVLTENWYLQWGVEMGIFGLVLSLLIPLLLLSTYYSLLTTYYLPFLALSLAGLFLHSFEDAAVAMTVWVMVACPLGTFHPPISRR